MKFGVIIFPGSNCDHDAYWTISEVAKQPVLFSGTIRPISRDVTRSSFPAALLMATISAPAPSPSSRRSWSRSENSRLTADSCSASATAFRFFAKSGLLPGALMRNAGLKYVCKPVHIRVENTNTPYTQQLTKGEVLEIPIGHMEGNYFCDEQTLAELKDQDRIIFRYITPPAKSPPTANPNGSLENIAGICNAGRNVLGMMPHPERASEPELGMTDGVKIFDSLVSALVTK